MTDILVQGVPVAKYASNRPQASSIAYAVATAICYVYPYAYDVEPLAIALQARYGTSGDLSTENVLDALNHYGVRYINEQALVDAGNTDDLRHEIGTQQAQNLIQIFVLKNDSGLAIVLPLTTPDADGNTATDGAKLHPWSSGVSYALVRTGTCKDFPWAYYLDPMLGAIPYANFTSPTPVLWKTIVAAGIETVISILPSTVAEAPPASFRYYGGGNGAPDNTWPVAQPDVTQVVTLMRDQIRNDRAAASQTIVAQLTAQLVALDAQEDDTFSKTLFALSNGKVGNA